MSDTTVTASQKSSTTRSSTPKFEKDAKDRIKNAIRNFSKPLEALVTRQANETDTRLLITDFLVDALGFNKYEDLVTEYAVKSDFADYGLKIEGQVVAFVEAKRIGQALGEKQLRQIQSYAVNEGVEWMILSNGRVWQAYHLTGGLPVITDMLFEVDLMDDQITPAKKADLLYLISKIGLTKGACREYWQKQLATSPKSIAKALLSDEIVEEIRKEIRRESKKNISAEEIKHILKDSVLKIQF